MFRIAAFSVVLTAGLAHAADLPEVSSVATMAATEAEQLASTPGDQTYAVCRNAIAEWAASYEPTDMDVVMAGRIKRNLNGSRIAPLYVRIVYAVEDGLETREADVRCTVNRRNGVAVVPTPRN